jgi:urea transport system permease protein
MSTFLEQVFNGLIIASVLLLIALGLTFTFGQMGVINMAHGELIMAGAFTPYVLQSQVGLFAVRRCGVPRRAARSHSWSVACSVS